MSHQPVELEAALDRVAKLATSQLPAVAAASVVLWDKSQDSFSVSASTVPEQPAETAAHAVRGTGGASRWIVDNRRPCAVAEIGNDPFKANPMLERYGYRAYAGQPLMAGDQVLGVLYTLHREPHRSSPAEHAELAALARWAALVVAEAGRAEEARKEARVLRMHQRDLRRRTSELRDSRGEISLTGLIRICMSCKNVRNREGEWERIEAYLSRRSEVHFSHGLCADCSREIYLDPLTDPDL